MTFEILSLGKESEPTEFEVLEIGKPKQRTMAQEAGHKALVSSKAIASPIAGGYGDIQDLLLSLTSKAFGVDPTKVKEKLSSLAEQDENIPHMLPTSSEVKGLIEQVAPSSKAETPSEKTLEETLELGSSLANPLMGGTNVTRAAIGTLAGMGAKKAAEYGGLGENTQEIAKNIASILPLITTGKLTPSTKEAKQLYDAGIRAGLTEAELTPLLQSEKRLAYLGKVAKQSPKVTERMQQVESTLGDFYKSIKKEARTQVPYSSAQTQDLVSKMEDISHSWKQTLKAAPDKEAAIKYLDEALGKLKSEGASPESLINFFQDINAAVNWRAIKGGKKELTEVKNAIMNSLNQTSPKLAKDFEAANKLWSRLENFRSKVGWGNLEQYISLGKFAPLLYGLATFDLSGLAKLGGIAGGAKVARGIATELLTNPSWQSIGRNTLKAFEKNSPKIASLAYQQLKSKVRDEFPEEYELIEWPK